MQTTGHTTPAIRRHGHSAPRGQFFTPPTVARFLWEVVGVFHHGLHGEARVIDPAAGAGVLLDVGCEGGWLRARDAFGIEIDAGVVGERPRDAPAIIQADGLFETPPSLRGQPFDVAVGNPPFGRVRDLLTPVQMQRLCRDPDAPIAIWGGGVCGADGSLARAAGSRRVEQLFLVRALEFVRASGLVAFIVPDTLLSNRREQIARDWLAGQAQLLAAVALPASAFRRPGLNALAHLVLLRKAEAGQSQPILMQRRHAGRGQLAKVLREMLADLRRQHSSEVVPGTVLGTVSVAATRLHQGRWDAGYWVGRDSLDRAWPALGSAPQLGDHIELLTYGPIITGSQPRHEPHGVRSIRQGDFTETGLRRRGGLHVPAGSAHDPPRSRVRRGDLLLPRSGGGALGRNRVAVYDAEAPANIGCFVDLVRLRGLDPYYVWVFLRCEPGWGQIRSLINGVGTPNISFAEIRSLRIPLLDAEEQADFARAYGDLVLPHHLEAEDSPAAVQQAEQAFGQLVHRLECRLAELYS